MRRTKLNSKLKQLTNTELADLRKQQWENQDRKCAILHQHIPLDEAVLDHKHKLKREPAGPDGKGLLRGVLHRHANILEGKIFRIYRQYHLDEIIPLPKLLRNIANYIENPPMPPLYIHPSEAPTRRVIGKRLYNKICKYYFKRYPRRKILPDYPKKGKMTKEFQIIIEEMKDCL